MDPTAFAYSFFCLPPTAQEWSSRRDVFSGLGLKLYKGPGLERLPEKFRVFERELERCYCSGAFVACVILADALAEVFELSLDSAGRERLAADTALKDERRWLRERRNDLIHFLRAPNAVSLRGYIEGNSDLECDARQAASIVYHVARAFVRR
jgi:hypothetical protein